MWRNNFSFHFHGGPIGRKSFNLEMISHFLFVWAQTLQDGRTLYSQKILSFFFNLDGSWQENDVTRLTAKLKFQDMAKQVNIVKYVVEYNVNKELLSFDFWISGHFVTIFRNISTFQDATSPKAIDLFHKSFHICFYHFKLF